MATKKELTPRQQRFVEEYLCDPNATQAAIRAGYSKKTARQQGQRLLTNVVIAAAVKARRGELAKAHRITHDEIIGSLSRAVHFDPRKLYRGDGTLKAVHELDDETADALEGLEVVTSGDDDTPLYTKKYKWASKNAAREQAMKHLGLYREDNRQRGLADVTTEEIRQTLIRRLNAAGIDLADLMAPVTRH